MVGQATTIFTGTAGSVNAEIARQITNKAIGSALNYYRNKKNPLIDIYYGSLIRSNNFGVCLHPVEYNPKDSPPIMLNAGGAFTLAYEVVESYE